jgi:DNA-binding transcriptional regulator YiaG
MPNIAAVLKEEIARIARREVRDEVETLKKALAQYRTQATELKREVAALQKEVNRLVKAGGAAKPIRQATQAQPEAGSVQVRWSPEKLKRHRERLELSAEKFGKLFGVSGQTIHNWEGGTRPGREHLLIISQLRKLGKREAQATIEAKA